MTLTSTAGRPYGHVAQIIQNRLFFGSFHEVPKNDEHTVHARIDELVTYHPFYSDFGPINLAELYKACLFIDNLLKENPKRRVVICSDSNDCNRVNAAFLVASYMVIYHKISADQAYLRVQRAEPPAFIGYIDAALGEPSYLLHLQHTIKAVEKALKYKWLDFDNFDAEEYEYYERVENGDLNWIIPGKILSFCGPHDRSYIHNGYPYHAPEVYFDYFRANGVSTIVRLNTKLYDRKRFIEAGFDHRDLFFIDGSTPTQEIVHKFLEIVDNAKGAVAIHCKAGLGRTGTLIACWMMKHCKMTAPQCMAWLRICRPGSVIGPQQQFLIDRQSWCWKQGSTQGKHKSPLRVPAKTEDEKNANAVEISLDAKPVPKTSIGNVNNGNIDETEINDKGQSQGDRLNEMKLRSQRVVSKPSDAFISPTSAGSYQLPSATTPIKQLKLSTSPRSPPDPYKKNSLSFRMPISKVIVATTHYKSSSPRITTIKSARPSPYTSSPGNAKYALRPRKTLSSPIRYDPTTEKSNISKVLVRHHKTSPLTPGRYNRI
ncbi:unnamed protein product [Bursaphelenchus okinawaensis]|uniref:protein-tyrosine-phosphatase n=1 Tax=Bursaphelenchus okinawaensis TaxID=465554 RepID=A0A811K539_9BILA|nr:unnamed protein product [Bursaphelenchus okinawaensis]CAG9090883.1 unnamed protein product [Bursaphelenchus okinawaensis]